MVKYTEYSVVFREIPDKVTLAIDISNCPNHCVGCHSPELRRNIGIELTECELDRLITENNGVNCVCFMGEGNDIETIASLVSYVKDKYGLLTGLYTGKDEFDDMVFYGKLDYLIIGHYDEKCGPIDKKTTNQRMYMIENGIKTDITNLFWRKIG